jgi:hypothetical protein
MSSYAVVNRAAIDLSKASLASLNADLNSPRGVSRKRV